MPVSGAARGPQQRRGLADSRRSRGERHEAHKRENQATGPIGECTRRDEHQADQYPAGPPR